ncbi:HipA domain-containing protein [Natronospora cellulosivora (SeqCode)]
MNEQKYKIIDVSNWEIYDKGKGYSESYWLINPETRERALFKVPKYNLHHRCYGGSHWAEKIVSELGKILGLQMPEVDLALYEQKQGCISYRFLEKHDSLREGIEVMSAEVTKNNRENYYLKNILKDLEEYNLVEDFIKILIFDGFIGQTDRHEENWGIIISEKNSEKTKLAPIYDNASSLGRELLSHKIEQMLKDDNYFISYIERCNSCIKLAENTNPSQFEVLQYIYSKYTGLYEELAFKLKQIENDIIKKVVFKVPSTFMTQKQKELVVKILLERKQRLIALTEKGVD